MIRPAKVERDENGFWIHPDFPYFDNRELIPKKEWEAYWKKQGVKTVQVILEEQDNDLHERYFESGDPTVCAEWEPKCWEQVCSICNGHDPFLLLIDDTEDGPRAIFAIPEHGKNNDAGVSES